MFDSKFRLSLPGGLKISLPPVNPKTGSRNPNAKKTKGTTKDKTDYAAIPGLPLWAQPSRCLDSFGFREPGSPRHTWYKFATMVSIGAAFFGAKIPFKGSALKNRPSVKWDTVVEFPACKTWEDADNTQENAASYCQALVGSLYGQVSQEPQGPENRSPHVRWSRETIRLAAEVWGIDAPFLSLGENVKPVKVTGLTPANMAIARQNDIGPVLSGIWFAEPDSEFGLKGFLAQNSWVETMITLIGEAETDPEGFANFAHAVRVDLGLEKAAESATEPLPEVPVQIKKK